LPDAANAAQPVTRVTWYGASAYARHYGKRLLTESEWAYVVSKHLISSKKENIFYPSMVAATSQHPGLPFKNFRYPWEAFSNVGFRCAASPGNEKLTRLCLSPLPLPFSMAS
jgi:formylglycine-generating enzyme required for sulfatase activity